jgi:hypothetical protein
MGRFIQDFWEWDIWECRTLMKRDLRNGETYMYFVCDFNGRWLKNLNLVLY